MNLNTPLAAAAALALISVSTSPSYSAAPPLLQPEETIPEKVHPIDAAMEKEMDQNPSTGGQTEAIGKALEKWDRLLNQNFTKLMYGLDSDGKNRMRHSQRAWVAWRDLEIDSIRSLYGKLEGTMWVPSSAYAEMNLTRERALRLEFLWSLLAEGEIEADAKPVESKIRGANLTLEGSENNRGARHNTPPASTHSSPKHSKPHLAFRTDRSSGGGKDLILVINGVDHLMKRNLQYFNPTALRDWGKMGVPSGAEMAGSFLEWGDHPEDAQGIFFTVDGSRVVAYTGHYVPGAMHSIQWRRLRTMNY